MASFQITLGQFPDSNLDQFSSTFRKYAEIYSQRSGAGKGMSVIILERAGKLAYELFKQTEAIAPTQSDIAADVQKLGWKIPEKFPDGRIGRGTPDQWAGTAIKSLPKVRGRKTKERRTQEAGIRSQKPTLQMMQQFVIKHRTAHRKFIASGWLGAISQLGGRVTGTTQLGSGGRAEYRGGEIDIINDRPGCVAANQKHNFVQKAIDAQTSDMAEYVATRLTQDRIAA